VRLASLDGQVQLLQGGQVLADHAVANTPLFEGTQLVTGNDGRAEIQFEDGSVARISPDSAVTLSILRGRQGDSASDTEILLNSGLSYFETSGTGQGNPIRVRFGDAVVTATGATVLRINLDNKPSELAVFSGNAHLEASNNLALDLHGGESVALDPANPSASSIAESIKPDSWDAWNSDRDQAMTAEQAGRTQATNSFGDPNNPAWNDLDANGSWYNVPNQGYVWSPSEASNPDWDPYGTGSWMYTPSSGYMWVSGENWGYMPYQCGMWNYYNSFGWGWAPGGCRTWWGGVGGWGFNIGYYPPRYRFPIRPRGPRPMGGFRAVGPQPLITVNRRYQGGNTVLPPRDRNTPVAFNGTTVRALGLIPVRPQYDHGAVVVGNRVISGAPVNGLDGRPGIPAPGASRPTTIHPYSSGPPPSSNRGPSRPAPSGGGHSAAAPGHSPSGGSAPASHASGGGGGGGGGGHAGGGSHR
jgi:hypothetical protein